MKSNPAKKGGGGGGGSRYKGVRMRKWGKWVAEVRQPNSRTRIWLGSYQTETEAARAYDAGVVCLRGASASLNFPEDPPPDIPTDPDSLSTSQIQVAAAKHARKDDAGANPVREDVIDVVFNESSGDCQVGAAGDQCYSFYDPIGQLPMETVYPPQSTAEEPGRDDSDVSHVVFFEF